MFGRPKDPKPTPTILGIGSRTDGNMGVRGVLQINGLFEGELSAETLVVGIDGQVRGNIRAENLFIHGLIDGHIVAGNATIMAHAKITGELQYRNLTILNNDGLDCRLKKRTDSGAKK